MTKKLALDIKYPGHLKELTWETVNFYFPEIDPAVEPVGSKVIIQYKTPMRMTAGGIVLTDVQQETQSYWTQTAKIIAMGPTAFRDINTLERWPEVKLGYHHARIGDFIRTPLHNQDRWKIKFTRDGGVTVEEALFGVINDTSIYGTVRNDPAAILAFD